MQLGERLSGWNAPAEMFTRSGAQCIQKAPNDREFLEQAPNAIEFLAVKIRIIVLAGIARSAERASRMPGRCTRAQGADVCSGDHTAGVPTDGVREPVDGRGS